MKLTPIAANQTLISYNNGSEVFFSYSTPVASTTTKHINKYLGNIPYHPVSQETIDNLVGN